MQTNGENGYQTNRDALLTEYSVCQNEADTMAGLAGLVFFPLPQGDTNWTRPVLFTVFTGGVMFMVFAWWRMAKRHMYVRDVMFFRRRQIERSFSHVVLKSTAVIALDEDNLPEGIHDIAELHNHFSNKRRGIAFPWLEWAGLGLVILGVIRLIIEWVHFWQ
jgi:hypothetical protein